MYNFTPTKWSSVVDKHKFLYHFLRFKKSGYKRSLFYKWFYTRLSCMFGHIAHYNIEGFYSEKFRDKENIQEFERNILQWPCYGDADYTFSDVEKAIQKELKK